MSPKRQEHSRFRPRSSFSQRISWIFTSSSRTGVKVRVFLQHLKGVKLDLDLAEITGPDETLANAISLIDDWFVLTDSKEQVAQVAVGFLPQMHDALASNHETHAPRTGRRSSAFRAEHSSGTRADHRHHPSRRPAATDAGARGSSPFQRAAPPEPVPHAPTDDAGGRRFVSAAQIRVPPRRKGVRGRALPGVLRAHTTSFLPCPLRRPPAPSVGPG